MKTIQDQFLEALMQKIKVGWILTKVIQFALKNGIYIGMNKLQKISEALYDEVLALMINFVDANKLGMVDEAADVLGEIVKVLFFAKEPNRQITNTLKSNIQNKKFN